MNAQMYRTPRVPVSIIIAVLLIILLPMAAQLEWPAASSAPPVLDIYSHPHITQSQAVLARPTTKLTLPDGVLPDFPQCNALNISRWCWNVQESDYEEGHVIDVDLMSEGRVVGNIQLLEMDIGYVELEQVMASYTDTVWLSAIKVARYARLNGIGKLMRVAGDKVLAYIMGQDGVDRAYHVFYNSSGSNGWMQSVKDAVYAGNFTIIYQDAEMFIYEVTAW
jgi:hypothetical protein